MSRRPLLALATLVAAALTAAALVAAIVVGSSALGPARADGAETAPPVPAAAASAVSAALFVNGQQIATFTQVLSVTASTTASVNGAVLRRPVTTDAALWSWQDGQTPLLASLRLYGSTGAEVARFSLEAAVPSSIALAQVGTTTIETVTLRAAAVLRVAS